MRQCEPDSANPKRAEPAQGAHGIGAAQCLSQGQPQQAGHHHEDGHALAQHPRVHHRRFDHPCRNQGGGQRQGEEAQELRQQHGPHG